MTNRLTGLTGVAGALLFFCGDMLFYGRWGQVLSFTTVCCRCCAKSFLARDCGWAVWWVLLPLAYVWLDAGMYAENLIRHSPLAARATFFPLGGDDGDRKRCACAVGSAGACD